MKKIAYFLAALFVLGLLACRTDPKGGQKKSFKDEFYIDKDWIEVHFDKAMPTEKLVEIRERLAGVGIVLKYLNIQRDSNKHMTNFQIEVHDGKGSIARSRTEFLDEIPYGIRIKRTEPSNDQFKVGPLYQKRPQ
ncbi:MAG: hypothetical protein IPM34_08410 [Saprospiraceae bacterium]|nr:hypothetical protein [Saprospiraceae bacterium]